MARFLFGRGERAGEPEPVLVRQRAGHADDAGALRAIKIQATRIVPGPEPEAVDLVRRAGGTRLIRLQVEGVASFGCRRIVKGRQHGFRDEREPAGSRAAIAHPGRVVLAEGLDRHDEKDRGADERNGEHASTAAPGRVAEAKPRDAGEAGLRNRACRGGRQPRADGGDARREEQRTAEEERGRIRDRVDHAAADREAGRDRETRGRQHPPARARGCADGERRAHIAGEQRARRRSAQRAQRPPDDAGSQHDASGGADRERYRGDVHAQVRRSDRADPPRPKTQHDERGIRKAAHGAQRGACDRQRHSFEQEQPLDLRDREADRAEGADFPQALLDAEPEEQGAEQQRRGDQKEAEVREVLAEVGRSLRRLERLAPRGDDGQARAERIELAAQRELELRRLIGKKLGVGARDSHPHRRHLTEPGAPQCLTHFERHERLRRRPVLVPILLVGGTDPREVERKRRVPVGQALGFGDARIVRSEVAIGGVD